MPRKKKVAIVGTNGIPARYGGFETLSEYLSKELSDEFDITVYCSSIYKNIERKKKHNGAKLIYFPFKANGIQSIFYDSLTTFHAWLNSDVIMIFGPAAGFILPFNKLFNKKIIVNHGGLNEWEREKLNFFQRKYVFLNHKIAARFADFNIADNLPLSLSLNKTFGVRTANISYGGDHIKKVALSKEIQLKHPFLSEDYDLSVSRAQVDNNLHLLLKSYIKIPNRNFVLISNWQVSQYGIALKNEYLNKYPNIHIVDAIYNKNELDIIRSNTSIYIHSHSRCGTAPSLVEAMHYNIPVICFDVETNRATTEGKSLYFSDENSLISILQNCNKKNLNSLNQEMYKVAREKYTWSKIAAEYKKLIQN